MTRYTIPLSRLGIDDVLRPNTEKYWQRITDRPAFKRAER